MPCYEAILKKPVTVSPTDTVEQVIAVLDEHKVSAAPVVDQNGTLHGVFSMKILLSNLIPVSVAMADGIRIDMKIGAAPGVARRLAHVKPLPVSELMERKVLTVRPDSPLWEGVSLLTSHGGSLSVVDENMRFLGLITYSSLVSALEKLSDTAE